ncbi:hypothetical protein V2J09_020649 [Rumex salicifolius]
MDIEMASMAQMQYSPLSHKYHHHRLRPSDPVFFNPSLQNPNLTLSPSSINSSSLNILPQKLQPGIVRLSNSGGGGGSGAGVGGNGGGSGWSSGGGHGNSDDSSSSSGSSSLDNLGLIGLFIKGWQSRVAADPQFPFKVLMEELVGVSSCVLGDMASRPNFGLNELDFVFSTLVVGSILNFVLMYLLAPSLASSASTLPSIFASCPQSHMFEPGAFTLLDRFGTFVYKGALFSAVGFAAGLVGTAISNGLIAVRKKMDPEFETPNKPPPTLLNAGTWAIHMGLSSNLRYQTLNGVEFVLSQSVQPVIFKTSVIVLRCLNNILGGMSFVVLARLTGSQSTSDSTSKSDVVAAADFEEQNLHAL